MLISTLKPILSERRCTKNYFVNPKCLVGEFKFDLTAMWFRSFFIRINLEDLLHPVSQQGRFSDINLREKNAGSRVFQSNKSENAFATEGVEEYITGCFLPKHLAEHILGEGG